MEQLRTNRVIFRMYRVQSIATGLVFFIYLTYLNGFLVSLVTLSK